MIKEGIEAITKLVEQKTPRIVTKEELGRELPESEVLIVKDGEVVFLHLPPFPARIHSYSAAGFIAATDHLNAPGVVATVLVGLGEIRATIDREEDLLNVRDADSVNFKLEISDAFAILSRGGARTHAQFCRILHTDLHGAIDESIVSRITELTFSENMSGKSTFNHGTEGLGKEVMREVGGNELPHKVVVNARVYENVAEWTSPVSLDCLLEVDWEDGVPTFALQPVSGVLDWARADAVDDIAACIEKTEESRRDNCQWIVLPGCEIASY